MSRRSFRPGLRFIVAACAVIGASAPGLVAGPFAQAASPAVEGSAFAGEVVPAPAGCSTDPASGPAPTIDWGDQTPFSPGVCTQNPSGVRTGPHTYAEEGDYPAVAHYTSPNGARTTPFSVHVNDAALSGSGAAISAAAGAPFSGIVAHFSDADPNGVASDYAATITWGDGATSGATVQHSGAGFDVTGSHTYGSAGSFPLSIAITDAGGASTSASGSAAVTAPMTTTTSAAVPPPSGAPPTHASFTLPPSTGAGNTVVLDAASSRQPGVTILTYRWTVNGRQLADCASATSQLMTRTLPVGTDSIGLTLVGASGALATSAQKIVVRPVAALLTRALAASVPARVRVFHLPAVAVCLSGPGDPRSGRVAPNVAGAPGLGCSTQVKSGTIDAVGCLTEYQDTIQVTFVRNQRGHSGNQLVSLPSGQRGLDGVQSAADTGQLLQDVENALNPPHPRLCVDSNGNDYICSTVGNEQLPTGASFGRGGPVEGAGGGAAPGVAARVASGGAGSFRATAARLTPAQSLAFVGASCPPVKPAKGETGVPQCLDLWVSTGPVRINGIDYAPPAGGEIVIAPQFNLLISQRASTSLDALLLNPSDPFHPVNFQLPATGASPGVDYPALTVTNLSATLAHQPNPGAASAIIAALRSVGGFPSVDGDGLKISFANDTATITFNVQLPKEFDAGGNPVTAAVEAEIGPTQTFHIVYGYLGGVHGGASVDLGPVALSGFALCFREHYSPDGNVDPCQGMTGIDDSGLGDNVWMGVGSLDIGGLLDVEFRPGLNTIPGCSGPLGFAFSRQGGLNYAGAAVDLSGSGGIPIFTGVSITGFAAGFQTTDTYNTYNGCVSLKVLDLLSITGNVFGVHTVDGHPYQFHGDELGPNVLQRTGGSYPYTDHVGFGASGVVSLTLPELPAFQVGDAYALYVDDPAAVFFGAGLDLGFPHGNYEDQPGTGFVFKGGIKGAIGLGGGFPFDFEGYAAFQANALGFNVIGGDAQLIISYNPHHLENSGIGACFGLTSGNSRGSAGIAYHWGDSYFDLPDDLKLGGCDNNWLDSQIGVNVQAASAGGKPANVVVARVPRGLNGVNLRLHSATDAPDVTITAPGGARTTTAGLPPDRIVKGSAFTLARYPASHLTIIAPATARAGRYRITLNPGSPPITRLDRLDGFRPRISANVTGDGKHRRLMYSFTRRPGQSVEFFEISGQVHRPLGSTTGGHGSLAFTASAGHGRRRIVAEVFGDGAPSLRTTVSSYLAPSLLRLSRVAHLRVRHSRDRAIVTFSGARRATIYQVYMRLSDGTRQIRTTRAHRTTFGPIFVDSGGTITVRAIGDGLNTTTSASVRAKLAPLFGRGTPVRKRARTGHRHR
jgi:hypothetical protein